MAKVVVDISMSLDGFVTASKRTPEEPLGEGGERLHDWAFAGDARDRELMSRAMSGNGAVVAGRRTYDDSVRSWQADGPTGPDRIRQCVAAGLVDEISVHLVPVLFGGGLRLFEHLGDEHVQLETAEVVRTASAVHLRWRVLPSE